MRTARADSLTWDVTADVGRFGEAIDFFSKRVVMTRDEALALDLDARRRAFWIGGGLQLSQVQQVFGEIDKAIASGEDYAAFRKRVLTEVAIKPAHLDTVFRNATQRSYNAGRWEQMQAAKALRPYVMFDVVVDDRTTKDICLPLDGKVVSIDDPFLKAHSPQRHHRCRTGLRSLRAKDAERRGIASKEDLAGAPAAAAGFGQIPSDAPVWKPDKKTHDPKLVDALTAKEDKPPKPKRKKKAPKTHDPAHWEPEYRKPSDLAKEGYGDAAPALAWGRAMLERGLDRPAGEVLAELRRLQKDGHPGLKGAGFADLEQLDPAKPLRKTALAATRAHDIALAEHSLTINRTGGFVGLDRRPDAVEAARFYNLLLDGGVTRPVVKLKRKPGRAYYDPNEKVVVLAADGSTSTAVHELAHAIEDFDARALSRSGAFLEARTVGDAPKRLRDLKPFSSYADNEITKEDRFPEAYAGKLYFTPTGRRYATEVTSMGYQELARPFGLEDLWEKDRDFALFLLGQLAGR
jgi:SPP1 gp7 family putative phage head morphogenesis protein